MMPSVYDFAAIQQRADELASSDASSESSVLNAMMATIDEHLSDWPVTGDTVIVKWTQGGEAQSMVAHEIVRDEHEGKQGQIRESDGQGGWTWQDPD